MAGITIAGTAYDVAKGGEGKPTYLGEFSDSFNGTERSSIRGQKRNFNVTMIPYSEAIYDTLRAAVAQRTPVAVTGAVMSNDSLTMAVELTAELVSGIVPNLWVISAQGVETTAS